MECQRHQIGQRTRTHRGSRRISTDGTRGAHTKPLVNTLSVKAMVAIRDAPHLIPGLVLGQADGANGVVALGEAPAFAEHQLRVRVYGGPVEAHYDNDGVI